MSRLSTKGKRGLGLGIILLILLRIFCDYVAFHESHTQLNSLDKVQIQGIISEAYIDDYDRRIYKVRAVAINGLPVFGKRYSLRMIDKADSLQKPGQLIKVEGKIKRKELLYNDGMKEEANVQYAYRQLGTIVIQSLKQSKTDEILVEGYSSYIQFVSKYHEEITDRWETILPSFDRNLLDALFFGNRSHIDRGFTEGLKKGGIIHVFAVSGMHIGMLYLVLGYLSRCIPGKPFVQASFVALALGGYILFIGCPVSAFRAVVMCYGVLYGKYSLRPSSVQRSLCLAAGVSLHLFPESLYSVSFWLSFVSVIAIIEFYPLGVELLVPQKNRRRLGMQCLVWSIQTLLLSACVLLLTTPILICFFGEVSFNGLLLNIIVLPVIPILFWCGLSMTIMLYIAPHIAILMAPVVRLLSYYFQWMSIAGRSLPFSLYTMPWSWIGLAIYYLMIMFSYFWIKEKTKERRQMKKEVEDAIRI